MAFSLHTRRRSVGRYTSPGRRQRAQEAAFTAWRGCPPPGRGFRLSVALWGVPALAPGQAILSREPFWVDVQEPQLEGVLPGQPQRA